MRSYLRLLPSPFSFPSPSSPTFTMFGPGNVSGGGRRGVEGEGSEVTTTGFKCVTNCTHLKNVYSHFSGSQNRPTYTSLRLYVLCLRLPCLPSTSSGRRTLGVRVGSVFLSFYPLLAYARTRSLLLPSLKCR